MAGCPCRLIMESAAGQCFSLRNVSFPEDESQTTFEVRVSRSSARVCRTGRYSRFGTNWSCDRGTIPSGQFPGNACQGTSTLSPFAYQLRSIFVVIYKYKMTALSTALTKTRPYVTAENNANRKSVLFFFLTHLKAINIVICFNHFLNYPTPESSALRKGGRGDNILSARQVRTTRTRMYPGFDS